VEALRDPVGAVIPGAAALGSEGAGRGRGHGPEHGRVHPLGGAFGPAEGVVAGLGEGIYGGAGGELADDRPRISVVARLDGLGRCPPLYLACCPCLYIPRPKFRRQLLDEASPATRAQSRRICTS
jgi:hypothetical protein